MLRSWRVKEICERTEPTTDDKSRFMMMTLLSCAKKQRENPSWFCAFFVQHRSAVSAISARSSVQTHQNCVSSALLLRLRERALKSEIHILSQLHYHSHIINSPTDVRAANWQIFCRCYMPDVKICGDKERAQQKKAEKQFSHSFSVVFNCWCTPRGNF